MSAAITIKGTRDGLLMTLESGELPELMNEIRTLVEGRNTFFRGGRVAVQAGDRKLSLAEITRLGVKMGANPLTFSGLAGAGDLILTCTGDLSRNRAVGIKLGKGLKIKEILSGMKMIAEGVKTTKSAYELSRRYQVEMPITEQVYLVIYKNKKPERAVSDLMGRDLKTELEKVNIMKGG